MALSATLAATPVLPSGIAAAEGSGSGTTPNARTGGSEDALANSGHRVVLETGSQGALVAALQRRLNEVVPDANLAVDGIYGSLTRAAVTEFQGSQHLAQTGALDASDWAILFRAPVMPTPAIRAGTPPSSLLRRRLRPPPRRPPLPRPAGPLRRTAPSSWPLPSRPPQAPPRRARRAAPLRPMARPVQWVRPRRSAPAARDRTGPVRARAPRSPS